jgi:NitT/TauT family transport system ATP-binding protein
MSTAQSMELVSSMPPENVAAPSSSVLASDEPVMRVESLSVTYQSSRGPTEALVNVSLSLQQGEFVSVLGPSGCGKSTLLSVVAGLQSATLGRATIFGTPVDGKPHPNVGIIFQRPTLLPWLTVLENILIPIEAMRRRKSDYMDRAQDLLKLVSLESFARHYPSELSGGMQQRVALARAMIHRPGLLLMDEPFAALDAMTRERMSVELQDILRESGQSVLFITHSIPEAVFLSDRVLMMSDSPGRIIEEVAIGLGRPRVMETMAKPEFAEMCGVLRKLYIH